MMPKKSTSGIFQKGYCILFLALPFFAKAQDDFTDNIDDLSTQEAPIDNYSLLLLILGIYFAYRFFKTQYAIKTNK
jgi:amino acid permease